MRWLSFSKIPQTLTEFVPQIHNYTAKYPIRACYPNFSLLPRYSRLPEFLCVCPKLCLSCPDLPKQFCPLPGSTCPLPGSIHLLPGRPVCLPEFLLSCLEVCWVALLLPEPCWVLLLMPGSPVGSACVLLFCLRCLLPCPVFCCWVRGLMGLGNLCPSP